MYFFTIDDGMSSTAMPLGESPRFSNALFITPYDLDPRFTLELDDADSPALPLDTSLSVEENEKRLLRNALVRSGGNRTKAAELMGVSRRTLHRKLSRWPELDLK